MVWRRLSSTVCDDINVDFEDVLSKRLVLHRLLSTFFGDILVAFEEACSKLMLFRRLLMSCEKVLLKNHARTFKFLTVKETRKTKK